MSTASFKVGLIGAGYVSQFHVAALRRLPRVQLVGICDLDRERARTAAALAGTQPCGSLDDLLRAGVNVVHVLTPPATHAALAIAALAGGCHVLVEKPLATSAEDCDRIAVAAENAGKLVRVNHSLLCDPFVVRALARVRRGAIGDVVTVDYFRSSEYPPYPGGPLPPQYRDGGYPFRDLGVHALYLLQAFLGEIREVNASFRDSAERCQVSGVRCEDGEAQQVTAPDRRNPGQMRATGSAPDTRHPTPETSYRKRDPNLLYDEWRAVVHCARGTGQAQLSWNVRPIQHQLFIQGTRGTLRVDLFSLFQARRQLTPLPKAIERATNALGEACQIATQVPVNAARFLTGGIRPYHGLQTLVAEFYERLSGLEGERPREPLSALDTARPSGSRDARPPNNDRTRSLPSVADARPIVVWTEKVAQAADEAKRKYLKRFPTKLTAPILVTGASGFIGRHLVRRLLADGERVRALVRSLPGSEWREFVGEEGFQVSGVSAQHAKRQSPADTRNLKPETSNVELVLGDLGDAEAVDRAVAGTRLVYHLGAALSGSREEFQRSTVVGTQNILASSLKHGVPKLVYVSSLSVLHAAGQRSNVSTCERSNVREDWPLEPHAAQRGAYTQTKLEAENLVRQAVHEHGLAVVILRPGQVFGPGAPLLTPAVARRVGQHLIILGDGQLVLPLVYVEDVIEAIVLAGHGGCQVSGVRSQAQTEQPIARPETPAAEPPSSSRYGAGRHFTPKRAEGSASGPKPETSPVPLFHIVDDGVAMTQEELAVYYAGRTGGELEVRHVPLPVVKILALGVELLAKLLRRPPPLSRYRVRSALAPLHYDCTAAHAQLGWQPRVGVREGLKRTL